MIGLAHWREFGEIGEKIYSVFTCRMALLMMVLWITASVSYAASLEIATYQNVAPASLENLKRVLDQTGIGYGIAGYPWSRAYAMALQDANSCAFPMDRTKEREPVFKWVGPIVRDAWVVYGLGDRSEKLASIEDLKGKRIASYSSATTPLAGFLKAQGIDFLQVTNDDLVTYVPKLLQSGRIDYWIGHRDTSGLSSAVKSGPALKVILTLKEVDEYLACNKSVPDPIIDRMNGLIGRAGTQ